MRNCNSSGNVIPLRRLATPISYAAGVVPFDHGNPDHIQAWNALFEFGRFELARLEMEGRNA